MFERAVDRIPDDDHFVEVSFMSDPSFDIDPRRKGSYRRRAEDIERALREMNVARLSSVPAFLLYYFACEKLLKIMIGVRYNWNANKAARQNLDIGLGKKAIKHFDYPVSQTDFELLFASKVSKGSPNSARILRNQIVHDIGPTHARQIEAAASHLVPVMRSFVGNYQVVVDRLVTQAPAHAPSART